ADRFGQRLRYKRMGQVVLKGINKFYDSVHAVKDVNLQIRDKEFVVFVGPSGCGKTTTLRMIAGLEAISSGDISVDGTVVNELAPMDRGIAMVFQNYALYPHMSVYEDRKSTRLNSSHLVISYAVFCLKKKKKHNNITLST